MLELKNLNKKNLVQINISFIRNKCDPVPLNVKCNINILLITEPITN